MARKKTQWITQHDDTDEKAKVRNILASRYSLHALQDEVLYFSKVTGRRVVFTEGYYTKEEIIKKFHIHYPDLFCPHVKPELVCEIDGSVHWENSRAVKRTNERNCHYEQAGLRFLWLTSMEVLQLNERGLVEIITSRTKILPGVQSERIKINRKNKRTKKSQRKL